MNKVEEVKKVVPTTTKVEEVVPTTTKVEEEKKEESEIVRPEKLSNYGEVEVEIFKEDNELSMGLSGIRYLKNVGKPTIISATMQKSLGWITKNGHRMRLDIIIPDRDGGDDYLTEGQDKLRRSESLAGTEQQIAKRLGLKADEKAFILYDFQTNVEKIEKLPIEKTIKYINFPHLLNVQYISKQSTKDIRIYNILMGQIAEVENENDFILLKKNYGFLIEVDRAGRIIENDRSNKINKWLEGKEEDRVDLRKYEEGRITVASDMKPFAQRDPNKSVVLERVNASEEDTEEK